VGIATTGHAAIDFTANGGGNFTAVSPGLVAIPDYPSSGVAFGLNFNHSGFTELTDISFTFTTTGGWNGDLYAYLSHGSAIAVLLNRVGANASGEDGFGTAGFTSITLGMGTANDIHGAETPTSGGGPYSADGRLDYTVNTRGNTLDVFNGANPNGAWTLYFSDQSSLLAANLDSWSLDITAVPEPTTWALGIFGGIGGIVGLVRWRARRKLMVES